MHDCRKGHDDSYAVPFVWCILFLCALCVRSIHAEQLDGCLALWALFVHQAC